VNNFKYIAISLALAVIFSLQGCGGDEESPPPTPADGKANAKEDTAKAPKKETQPEPEEEPEPEPVPDPNGVYLPNDEEYNGKPVYADGDGFYLWFNGLEWRISDKMGAGKSVASGKAAIMDPWSNGARTRHHPSEDYAKDATFRLAVAFQGSEDHVNAIRLFNQFVKKFPTDQLVADAHLSLGDLSVSGLKGDEQPSYEQISNSRMHYGKVRELTQKVNLVRDSYFNEGQLIENVAVDPEGHVNHYLTFDTNKNEELESAEYAATGLADKYPFSEANINGDKVVDWEELYEVTTISLYASLETLFREFLEKFGDQEDSGASQATKKIGMACEKQGRPAEMLKMYHADIKKFGNDPGTVGVDEILKIYSEKYDHYDKLFGNTHKLLTIIKNPGQTVEFAYKDRKGSESTISGTVEEILKDRRKLLPWLGSEFKGMEQEVYDKMVRARTSVYTNDNTKKEFDGLRKKYEKLVANFPNGLSPAQAFKALFDEAQSAGQTALALRMRAMLEKVGAPVSGTYVPNRGDFPNASPGVLVWMGKKLLAQNQTEDAIAAMERLVHMYGETGGEFLFDAHYVLGEASERERDHKAAANHFDQALTNSSWHENAGSARIRMGRAYFEIGKTDRDKNSFGRAASAFEQVRNDTDMALELRAESSFMMGDCLFAQRDAAGAVYYFMDTALNFPASVTWAEKSFLQAIRCFEQLGKGDEVTKVEKQYNSWSGKYK
jgi:TolA-binding protein